jgi:MFS family permease
MTGFVIVLGRSLLMNDLSFGAMAISTTGAIGGIVGMPLPLLVGWLSDRAARRIFLYLGCLAGITALAIDIRIGLMVLAIVLLTHIRVAGSADGCR